MKATATLICMFFSNPQDAVGWDGMGELVQLDFSPLRVAVLAPDLFRSFYFNKVSWDL